MFHEAFVGQSFKRTISAIVMAGLLCSHAASAQTNQNTYEPTIAQAGKDVIWVPTPNDLVVRMLETAKVSPNDLVFDLGAGDGKIPIQAARQFGSRAVGIEFNPDMANLARQNAQRANVSDKVTIVTGDILRKTFPMRPW